MYERFTDVAKRVIAVAHQETKGVGVIRCVHVLSAILRLKNGLAYEFLANRGVTLEAVREFASRANGVASPRKGRPATSVPSKHMTSAVHAANDYASSGKRIHVGTEDLLYGLLSFENSAMDALRNIGVEPHDVKSDIERFFSPRSRRTSKARQKKKTAKKIRSGGRVGRQNQSE